MKFKHILSIILLFIACGVPPKEKAKSILEEGIKDESPIIKLNAARGLHEISDPRGIKIILEVLKGGDKDAVVAALDVLGELRIAGSFMPSILALARSESPLIRAEAFRYLSGLTDPGNRETLVKGTEDRVGKVRKYAYLGLEYYKEKDLIMKGLRDSDQAVRLNCAMVLGRLGEKGMENLIKNDLNKNMSAEFLVEGCYALAGIGDTTVIPFLKELLVDMPWDIRIAASDALLKFKKRDGIPVIKDGLKAQDPFVRVKCVEVIKRYNLADFYPLLVPALDDMYINVSIAALRAMSSYKKKESAGLFEKLLSAPNPLVRIAAASAYLQSQ